MSDLTPELIEGFRKIERAAVLADRAVILAALDEADAFNERAHHGAFYGGWKRAILHVRASLAERTERGAGR